MLTSDAGVCFHGKKGFTGVGFDTVVAGRRGGGCGRKKVSETKDDLVEGEKAGEPGQNVMKFLNYSIYTYTYKHCCGECEKSF